MPSVPSDAVGTPEAATSPDAATRRPLTALASSVVLLGLADSVVGSSFVLFLTDRARLHALQVGALFSLPSIGGIAVSLWLGRRFDARPTRRWAAGAALASAAGYALMTTTTSFAGLLVISLVLLAAYQSIYPQLFSLSRTVVGEGAAGRRAVPLLRSGWSLAWAVGPLLGALLVPTVGFDGALWAAAAALVLVVAALGVVPSPRSTRAGSRAAAPRSGSGGAAPTATPAVLGVRVVVLVASVVLFFLAMFAGSIALPLHAVRALHQPQALVGWMYSLCAAVEILVTLGIAAQRRPVDQRLLVAAAMAALAVHFILVVAATGPALLLVAQVPRGAAIAVVSAAGVRYLQDVLAPATGTATSLFAAATDCGLVLAGVLGGAAVQAWGSRAALAACAGVAVAGGLLFLSATGGPAHRGEINGADPSASVLP